MHRMRVLSRRLKSLAFFFSMVTAIPLVFAVLATITDGITEHSLLLASAALLCLFVAGVLWLVYGFAWAMIPEEAPREKENRPSLVSLSEEKETRSPLLSLSLSAEKGNRPLPPSAPEEKVNWPPSLSLTAEKENTPPPPSPPAEEEKKKKKKEKAPEEPIYTITGRRIN